MPTLSALSRQTLFFIAALVLVLAGGAPRHHWMVSPPVVHAQEPGDDALVAAYGFDEAIGLTATDASGNANTGTITGATWATAGRFGAALSFNGTSNLVTVPDSAALDLTTGMTLSAWVRPATLSGWRTAILKERPGGLVYGLYAYDNAPRVASYVTIGSTEYGAGGGSVPALNSWTHLASTYDGATLRTYVNGTQVAMRTIAGPIAQSTGALRIGGNAIWGEYFSGLIDEVRIHRRALSQTELQALMSLPVGQAPGFHILAYNPSLTIGLQDSATYNLEVSPVGGFTGPVTPSVTGVPAGATAIFEPPDGPPHPGPMALTVTAGPTAAPGTYTLSITAVNGSLTASAYVSLTINGTPGFRVVTEPNSLIVAQGESGEANFQLTTLNGYNQTLTLGTSQLPTGTTAAFNPPALIPTGQGTLVFNVGFLTPPGVYPITVTATDGVLTEQASFALTVVLRNSAGSWRQQALGDTPAMYYGTIVGDVGNIGRQRVIASAGDGIVYAYDYNGSTWSFQQIPMGVFADGEMHNGEIGPARGDGVNRLYIAAAGSGNVYEVSWTNGAWQASIMASLPGSTDITIGDGRNDGRTRMYVSWMSGTTEFTWNGTAWQTVTMSSDEPGWVHGIDMGSGRNDGLNRIYTANQGAGFVYEYFWNGSSWIKTLVDSTVSDSRNVGVGEGRNDGVTRLYTAAGDGNLYEFSWNGSAWQKLMMGNAGLGGLKVHATPTRARDDGLVRVYVAAANGGVYEFTWTGTSWQAGPMGAATAYMYGLDIGDALGKGTTQVFGTSYDGQAYIYEWMPAGPVKVPVVLGFTQAEATTTITNAGLVVGAVTTASSTTVAAGRVISQNPSGDTETTAGSSVSIVISTGPSPVTVPSVVGQTQSQAAATLNGVGLNVGTVATASSTTVPQGSVISQNPAPPALVAYGSSVALVVSSGPPPAGPLQERVLTSNGSGTRSTPAFSTTGPRLLVAFGSADGPPSSRQTLTLSGAGLQWTLVRRANVQAGASEIWVANASGPLTNAVVSCVQQFNSYRQSLTVVIFAGATGVGASAIANARTGAPTVSLSTTVANSRVYAVGNDWDRAVARTLGPNQVMINQVVDTVVGDTFWVQARSTPIPSAGTPVTINDTAPTNDRWNFAAVEIR